MTPILVAMVLALLVAFVVISVVSSEDGDDRAESRPGEGPDPDETDLGDLLDP